MPTSSPRRIFVSYTGTDAEIAATLAEALRLEGHLVTIQATDFLPGTNFVLEMQRGLAAADHVVAVLSPEYELSSFASSEWASAFAQDPTGHDRRLIGVRVKDYRPSGLLRAVVYIDMVHQQAETAIEQLLAAVAGSVPAAEAADPADQRRRQQPRRTPHRVANFGGREEELAEIALALRSSHRVAITGLGGIGKTSLAAEVAYQQSDELDVLLWLYTPDTHRAMEEIVSVATRSDLIAEDADPESALTAVESFLAGFDRALVVLDDCPNADLANQLFGKSACDVLVTSRSDRGWSNWGYTQQRLGAWSVSDAAAYLTSSAPGGGDGAASVAAHLGGFPLALAQAAAYTDTHGITFDAYLERLMQHPARVFETAPGDYDLTVLSVWSLALDELKDEHPVANQLLNVLSLMDSHDFPRGILEVGSEVLTDPLATAAADPFELDAAIGQLLQQSLCGAVGDGLSTHPVVQSVVAGRLGHEERVELIRVCVKLLREALPSDAGPEAWATWDRLGPHIATLAPQAIAQDVYTDDLRPLVTELAAVTSRRGFPHFANAMLSEVLMYLAGHSDEAAGYEIVAALHDLADSFVQLRVADRGAELFRRVLELDEAVDALKSTRSIGSQVGLGAALTDTGEHDEADAVMARAAAAFESEHADDLELGIMLYGTWGRLLVRANRLGEGRQRLTRALDLSERAGRGPEVALTLLHLGNADVAERRLDEARLYFERALQIVVDLPHEQHLQANVLANLAGVAAAGGDLEEALLHTEEALEVLSELPEGGYSVTAATLHYQRAELRSRRGDAGLQETVAEAGSALDVLCDHLPPGHPDRRRVAGFLARIARSINDDRLLAEVLSRESDL